MTHTSFINRIFVFTLRSHVHVKSIIHMLRKKIPVHVMENVQCVMESQFNGCKPQCNVMKCICSARQVWDKQLEPKSLYSIVTPVISHRIWNTCWKLWLWKTWSLSVVSDMRGSSHSQVRYGHTTFRNFTLLRSILVSFLHYFFNDILVYTDQA